MKSDAGAKLVRATRYSRTHRQYTKYDSRSGIFLFPAFLAFTLGPAFWSGRSPWPFMTSFALAQPLEIATTT